MDQDLTDLLTQTPKESDRSVAIKRELERRSQDDVAVYNPTDDEHTEIFNRYAYRIPSRTQDKGYGKGIAILPRFVAENYIRNMTDKIIFREVQIGVDQENARRAKIGQSAMNKWEEQPQFEVKLGILMNPEKRLELQSILYKGIYKKFGDEDTFKTERKQQTLRHTDVSQFMFEADKKAFVKEDVADVAVEDKKRRAVEEISE